MGYPLFFILLTLIISCNKEDSTGRISQNIDLSIETVDLFQTLSEPSDGVAMVASTASNFNLDGRENVTYIRTGRNEVSILNDYSSILFDEDFSLSLDGNSNTFEPDVKYEKTYGKSCTVSIQNSPSDILNNEYKLEINLGYNPKLISLQNDNLHEGLNNGKINRWNKDIENTYGVFIIVSYDVSMNNEEFVSDHPYSSIDFEHVNDIGSYTFDVSDFPLIPEGSIVSIEVIRGNAKLITVEPTSNAASEQENDLKFVVYSKVSGLARFGQ